MYKLFRKIRILISVLLTVFMWNVAYAQDSVQHLEFKGIKMDGNINAFAGKLEKMGYVQKESKGNLIIMKGQFVGEDATIYIVGSTKTKTIWKISVYLPEVSSWYSIKSDYKHYKELYTKKYGAPKDVYEFFSSPYYEGDGYEMSALRSEKCHYLSSFEIPEGNIVVEITKWKQIRLSYEDKINTELKVNEDNSAEIDDI